MQAIEDAMKVIEANTYGDGVGSGLIRQQLEKVAKAARRQALLAASNEAKGRMNDLFGRPESGLAIVTLNVFRDALRRMAEEADLPTMADIHRLKIDITGGLSSEEFVRRLRDGECPEPPT